MADPVFVGDDMYALDMSNKKNQAREEVRPHERQAALTSPEIEGARAIPGMYVVGDQVLLQIGGAVEARACICKRESDRAGGPSPRSGASGTRR